MKRFLIIAVLVGCSSEAPRRLPPPSGEDVLRLEATATTSTWLTYYDTWLGSSAALSSPALRFDLQSIPEGAAVGRAVIRLRRGFEEISERRGPRPVPIDVTNVNVGLRIRRADADDRAILDAERVTDEEAVWSGLAQVHSKYQDHDYVSLLKSWNTTVPARLEASVEWDDLDVTALVQAELRGDRSITFLLSSTSIVRLAWFDSDAKTELRSTRNRPEFHPHLLVEIDAKKKENEPKVEPQPKTRVPSGTAKLRIGSTPAPAKIYVNDEFVATTLSGENVEIPVPTGPVKIRLVKKGFKPWEETVRVADGAALPIHAELEAE